MDENEDSFRIPDLSENFQISAVLAEESGDFNGATEATPRNIGEADSIAVDLRAPFNDDVVRNLDSSLHIQRLLATLNEMELQPVDFIPSTLLENSYLKEMKKRSHRNQFLLTSRSTSLAATNRDDIITERAPKKRFGRNRLASTSLRDFHDLTAAQKDFWKVDMALRTYNEIRLKVAQEKEQGNKDLPRPDLAARTKMTQEKLVVNLNFVNGKYVSRLGHLPGVACGRHFNYRQELFVVGIHSEVQAGIDCISAKDNEYKVPIAAAVVVSGGYEDDEDCGEWLWYTGSGGNDYLGSKTQIADQKLNRYNEGLKNNIGLHIPVRVVRKIGERSRDKLVLFSYDGLYRVTKLKKVKGQSGCYVFKFKLERLTGQPPLETPRVTFSGISLRENTRFSDEASRRNLVNSDLSKSIENYPVAVVNEIDVSPTGPDSFKYIGTQTFPDSFDLEKYVGKTLGCACKGKCESTNNCRCAQLNGEGFPYVEGGKLANVRRLVFECGRHCKCSDNCQNRVVQKGIKYRFEAFKTMEKGWGIRSWDVIPTGAFICEYVGMVMSEEDAKSLSEDYSDTFTFGLDVEKGAMKRGESQMLAELAKKFQLKGLGQLDGHKNEFLLEAYKEGNFSRFINHSCEPNLFSVCVFVDHHHLKIPRIALFAGRSIKPLEELTYDYGYPTDGEITVPCRCGSPMCSGKLL